MTSGDTPPERFCGPGGTTHGQVVKAGTSASTSNSGTPDETAILVAIVNNKCEPERTSGRVIRQQAGPQPQPQSATPIHPLAGAAIGQSITQDYYHEPHSTPTQHTPPRTSATPFPRKWNPCLRHPSHNRDLPWWLRCGVGSRRQVANWPIRSGTTIPISPNPPGEGWNYLPSDRHNP